MPDSFWTQITAQIDELNRARTADDVLTILAHDRDPDFGKPGYIGGCEDGFFAGSGGDATVREALREAGWTVVWSESPIWYCLQAPDGSRITYIEGDIRRGDPEVTA